LRNATVVAGIKTRCRHSESQETTVHEVDVK
jgi:hypothetical protein